VIERLAPGENPARLVYGVLAIGATLAAESGSHESYLDTAGSAVIAICLYWFAHAYADVLGHRLQTHERLSIAALGRALHDEATILVGAVLPLFGLVLCWAVGAALATGVEVALWSCVGSLIAFELIAGIRARSTPRELALEVGVGATMGLAIVALKVLLH
jgi:membrane protein YqaA with SNARE-associated domain